MCQVLSDFQYWAPYRQEICTSQNIWRNCKRNMEIYSRECLLWFMYSSPMQHEIQYSNVYMFGIFLPHNSTLMYSYIFELYLPQYSDSPGPSGAVFQLLSLLIMKLPRKPSVTLTCKGVQNCILSRPATTFLNSVSVTIVSLSTKSVTTVTYWFYSDLLSYLSSHF